MPAPPRRCRRSSCRSNSHRRKKPSPLFRNRLPPRPEPAQPSACQLRLAKLAVFQALGTIVGPGDCGAPDAVLLQAIILADQVKIAVTPPATLRCPMAEQIAQLGPRRRLAFACPLRSAAAGARQFRFLRVPRTQSRARRAAERAWPRRCARRARFQACRRPRARPDRYQCRQGLARKNPRQRLRAIFDRARSRFGWLSRRAHPSRSRRAAQRL